MKYINNTIVAMLSIVMISCEVKVNADDLINDKQLVVITGYLSPQDEIIKIRVLKSFSVVSSNPLDTEDLVIENAVVTISNAQGIEVNLDYNAVDLNYNYEVPAAELPIEPGNSYFLRVKVNEQEYRASCTIPLSQITDVEETFGVKRDPNGTIRDFINLKFNDLEGVDNYYVVGGIVRSMYGSGAIDFFPNQFITDTNGDGALIDIDGFFRDTDSNDTLNVKVTNVDKLIYDSLRATHLNNYNEGNPFAEPVIPPSNIEGENGYGVFAGYQLIEKEVIR